MKEASHPESDDSAYLSKERATQYRAIIEFLNWVVILGRFDVMYATDSLARFSIAPRVGHLCEAKRMLGYLKRYTGHRILLNPNPIDLSQVVNTFTEYDNWRESYPEAQEEIPDGIPEPMNNKKVQVTIMVDADHGHCQVTRRSVTGTLVFINSTPVRRFSKIQTFSLSLV
jgi:hypothetical protein